jgi:cell division protease FtsH
MTDESSRRNANTADTPNDATRTSSDAASSTVPQAAAADRPSDASDADDGAGVAGSNGQSSSPGGTASKAGAGRGGFSRLAALHVARTEEDPDGGNEDSDLRTKDPQDDDRNGRATLPATEGPKETLVTMAIKAAVTPEIRAKLRARTAVALVVSAPSSSWLASVKKFFDNDAYGRKWVCFARDGSERRFDKPSVGNDTAAEALASGQSVVGIAINPDQVLPATLIGATDIRLAVKIDTKVLRKTIRKFYGEIPPRIDERDLVGLDLDDIVAAMRPHSSAREATARITAAAKARTGYAGTDTVPDLGTAVEYGAAREWGLALARDVRDYRAGVLPWSAIDRGAVFFSGPGMGKSVLARSIARACDATLVVGSIGELFATSSGHLDGVIKAMRELFARAIAAAPSILFLDEIDGLPSRESLDSRNRDWWMPVIEDFMLLLDDATSARREGVVVIGATNRIEAVDPAILRPGRLERAIEITAPGPDGILNILGFHVRGSLPEDQLRTIVALLEGFTAADIMEAVRSARRTARVARRDLSIDDLKDAVLRTPAVAPDMLKRIAVHEAGHVVVATVCDPGSVKSARIGGRNGVGGITSIDGGTSDLATRRWIEQRVVMLLAGRAAEIVVLGAASAGAGGSDRSDLALATRMLASMELSFGLGDTGLVYFGDADEALQEVRRDPVARRRVDGMLQRLQARALEIVDLHQHQVVAVADALIERTFLSGDEIRTVLARRHVTAGKAPYGASKGSPP